MSKFREDALKDGGPNNYLLCHLLTTTLETKCSRLEH